MSQQLPNLPSLSFNQPQGTRLASPTTRMMYMGGPSSSTNSNQGTVLGGSRMPQQGHQQGMVGGPRMPGSHYAQQQQQFNQQSPMSTNPPPNPVSLASGTTPSDVKSTPSPTARPMAASPAPVANSQVGGPRADLNNTATVCRIGQETCQEIVGRMHEVFTYLKSLQPPVGGIQDRANLDKQQRLLEVLRGITHLFKRLNSCWNKAQEHAGTMEYMDVENLLPLKGERDVKMELEKKRGEVHKQALEENNELTQQLVSKNRHLKEIIDRMRIIIWEINTMLAVR